METEQYQWEIVPFVIIDQTLAMNCVDGRRKERNLTTMEKQNCGKLIKVRNLDYIPHISHEGDFYKDLPSPPNVGERWHLTLHPNLRLHYHQTMNSTRRFACFKQYPFPPKCEMDITLSAAYNHETDLFKNKNDVVTQSEKSLKGRLRNTRDVSPKPFYIMGHPLQINEIKVKFSPHSVKLMNSGHHTPLTNPGYSRQQGDGNFYRY